MPNLSPVVTDVACRFSRERVWYVAECRDLWGEFCARWVADGQCSTHLLMKAAICAHTYDFCTIDTTTSSTAFTSTTTTAETTTTTGLTTETTTTTAETTTTSGQTTETTSTTAETTTTSSDVSGTQLTYHESESLTSYQ